MKTKLLLTILLWLTSYQYSHSQNKSLSETTTPYFELVRPLFKGDLAYETTAFVEQFWRVPGNTGFNESIYRISSQLEAAGYIQESKASANDRLTYRIEDRQMDRPTWEPVDAKLTIVGENAPLLDFATNRNMIYQYAASTPKEGVSGELIYVEDPADLDKHDLSGKIVFSEFRSAKLSRQIGTKNGPLGILTYDNPGYLQPEKNKTSIQFRSLRYREESNAWGIALSYEAKEKLKQAISKGTVEVKVEIETKIYPSTELTVVANVKGKKLPKECLVFSAHVQEPGANDNASGVGTQLEMAVLTAKLVRDSKLDLDRTLTFLWGDEISSTRRYIADQKNKLAIKWGISLDMVGENTAITGGSFLIEKMPDPSAIWTRGNDKHSEWGGRPLQKKDMMTHYLNDFIIEIFEAQGKYDDWEVNTNPFEGGSDHTPFLRADIPGLLLWHFTDQFYHTDNDRIDKVSPQTMTNVGTAALVSAYTLLNADPSTGHQLIASLMEAAKKRLQAEQQLSVQAIKDGKAMADEVDIIDTWNDWYVKSLATIKDVAPKNNKKLNKRIAKAQAQLTKLSKAYISDLRALK